MVTSSTTRIEPISVNSRQYSKNDSTTYKISPIFAFKLKYMCFYHKIYQIQQLILKGTFLKF